MDRPVEEIALHGYSKMLCEVCAEVERLGDDRVDLADSPTEER
jgi:hypothetical protein